MAEYTEWRALPYGDGRWYVESEDAQIATIHHYLTRPNETSTNAHLIVAAVNGCASVNPNNPMAVAESIKDMYEALKRVRQSYTRDSILFSNMPSMLPNEIEAALAKAEGR